MTDDDSKPIESIEIYSGIYNDLAEIVGPDKVKLIHKNLKGQQVTFPQKLYSKEYIIEQVRTRCDGTNLKKLALEFDYTERHLKKILSNADSENK